MSLYNMVNGVNQIPVFFILPMLGKHPDEYPRFRDCFVKDEEHPEFDNFIHIYTRVGGGNRGEGYGEEELYKHPEYVTTFDDSFDSTYASYIFKVPEKWKKDFDVIVFDKKLHKISPLYREELDRIYPKLKESFKEILRVLEENLK